MIVISKKLFFFNLCYLFILFLYSCNFNPKSKIYALFNFPTHSGSSSTYILSGRVTGLIGTLIIENNLSESLTILTNGDFSFSSRYNPNSSYSISITSKPNSQSCTLSNSSGTFQNMNISSLFIDCKNNLNTLSSLVPSAGNLNPVFSSSNFNYRFTVLNSISSITLTPTANDSIARITINGITVSSGNSSGSISLNLGSNIITILVTAQDSSTSSYTLTIIRSTLNAYRIFITATTYNGNLIGSSNSGSLGADSKCESDFNKPSDGSTYKAMIVDTTNRLACSTTGYCTNPNENLDWVLKANTSYARTDGTLIFTTNSAGIFVFGTLTNSFGTGIYWSGISSTSIWRTSTGGNHCSQWTSSNSALVGNYGDASSLNSTSVANSSFTCDTLRALLCVEQ